MKRIDALEAMPPLEMLKGVRQALSRCYIGAELKMVLGSQRAPSASDPMFCQRLAWEQCVRFGLDGLLPVILRARPSRGYPDTGLDPESLATFVYDAGGFHKIPCEMPLEIDDFIVWPKRRARLDALSYAAYLGHVSTLAAVVRMGATCQWDDESTFYAFTQALDHNRRDVIRCFCTPKDKGGCGLELRAMPRKHREAVWRTLTQSVVCHGYPAMTWLGPDFDPDELIYEGSRGRRMIRAKYVWRQVFEMLQVLAECGMPMRKLVPRVSEQLMTAVRECEDDRGLDISGLPKGERKALSSLSQASAEYNEQFEGWDAMIDLTQFVELLRGVWSGSAGAADEGPEGEAAAGDGSEDEGEEGEGEGEDGDDSDGSDSW